MHPSLANLLQEPEHKISKVIARLESLSGYQNEDIRLLQKNRSLLRAKLASLGLDPDDTTAEELYWALLTRLRVDLSYIHRSLNLGTSEAPRAAAPKIISLAKSCSLAEPAITIKNSSIRKLLRANPPKGLMKSLNYRSLESMLKREDPRVLFGYLPVSESDRFNNKLVKDLTKLNHADFEMKTPSFVSLEQPELESRVTYVPLMGCVILWAGRDLAERTLEMTFLMLQAEELLLADNFYLKSQQMSPHFPEALRQVFTAEEPPLISIADQPFIDWPQLSDILSAGKLSVVDRLSKIHPRLEWWSNAAHLVHSSENPVSLHFGDIAKSLHSEASFAGRSLDNCSRAVRGQLLHKYAENPGVKNYILQQLNDKVIALDPVEIDGNLYPDLGNNFV